MLLRGIFTNNCRSLTSFKIVALRKRKMFNMLCLWAIYQVVGQVSYFEIVDCMILKAYQLLYWSDIWCLSRHLHLVPRYTNLSTFVMTFWRSGAGACGLLSTLSDVDLDPSLQFFCSTNSTSLVILLLVEETADVVCIVSVPQLFCGAPLCTDQSAVACVELHYVLTSLL
jgi:hypothetical protein